MVKTTLITTAEETTEQASSAVLAYRVGQLERQTQQGFADIKEQNTTQIQLINDFTHEFVTRTELLSAKKECDDGRANLGRRLVQLENWNRWIARIVFAIVISAVLAVIIYPTVTGHHL
jgi:ABC-type multidrug transport system fused ATPase/permease subunit